MKFFTGWMISAGLAVAAVGAQAQTLPSSEGGTSPYIAVSDFGGPYAAMPEDVPGPGYYGPMLLPAREVYAIIRENGFSPLGAPRQRGLFYTVAVVDRGGEDGRLVIDARNGRIIRFMPAYRWGDNYSYNDTGPAGYGSARPLPPMADVRGEPPRPPVSVPHLASRTPPLPKPSPLTARPAVEPSQQSASIQVKPERQAVPPNPPPVVEAKPAAPDIKPTQEMPSVQDLE